MCIKTSVVDIIIDTNIIIIYTYMYMQLRENSFPIGLAFPCKSVIVCRRCITVWRV